MKLQNTLWLTAGAIATTGTVAISFMLDKRSSQKRIDLYIEEIKTAAAEDERISRERATSAKRIYSDEELSKIDEEIRVDISRFISRFLKEASDESTARRVALYREYLKDHPLSKLEALETAFGLQIIYYQFWNVTSLSHLPWPVKTNSAVVHALALSDEFKKLRTSNGGDLVFHISPESISYETEPDHPRHYTSAAFKAAEISVTSDGYPIGKLSDVLKTPLTGELIFRPGSGWKMIVPEIENSTQVLADLIQSDGDTN